MMHRTLNKAESGCLKTPCWFAIISRTSVLATYLWICLLRQKETKAKMNYWGYTKTRRFCTGKGSIHKTKRPPTEFANDRSDKGLTAKRYKKNSHAQHQKNQRSDITMGRGPEETFFPKKTHRWGRQTHDKPVTITHHQSNAMSQNGERQRHKK